MLSKIVKHDFLSLNKSLLVIYLLSTISTLVVLIASSFNGDIAIATEAIAKDFALICLLITLLVPFFKCFFKIKDSLYKNEGYLTHTLPISKGTLYDGKMFAAIFTLIISWIIFASCFMSSFSGMNIIKLFLNVINDSKMLSTSIETISLAFTQLLFIFMSCMVGLILGSRLNKNKDSMTFLFGSLIYSIVNFIVLFIIRKLDLDYFIYMTIIFGILNIVLYFVGREIFKKGVNLE
jgi:hypothetical protein